MTQFSSQESPAIALDQRSAIAVRLSDHAALTKPGITLMVVITAFIGFAMGASPATWEPMPLLAALVGTGLSCMGSGVWNQIYERHTDALMHRTRNRPLPAGRTSVAEALTLAIIYTVAGLAVLGFWTNWAAAGWSLFTIVTYAAVYTPLKRKHHIATWIGAVPGAMPPIIGYTAATGQVGIEAMLLFAIMFAWQIPHTLAIGYLYREDYARAGLPILPVIDPAGRRTFRHTLVTSFILLITGMLPTFLGVTGWVALIVAALCGGAFLAFAIKLVRQPSRKQARALFLASLAYLPVVLTVLPLNQL